MINQHKRRLAAIVSVDVVGYSRLMGRDEIGTLAALRAHREELIDDCIDSHGGRIVKTMGDGLLLEFPSVVNATQCSVEIQQAMAVRNEAVDENRRITFRIGINLGDIIIEGEDILGDGVNIAARLQEIAAPGGIAISRRVHEDVRDRLHHDFRDDGEHALKNIARPVQVWQWSPGAFHQPEQHRPSAPGAITLPRLVFATLEGGGPEEAVTDFIAGLIDETTVALSHIRWLSLQDVVGDAVDTYQLSGAVRTSGSQLRLQYQLTKNGSKILTQRSTGQMDDPFALQEEFANEIASQVEAAILASERAEILNTSPSTYAAWEHFVLGYTIARKEVMTEIPEAIEHLEAAAAFTPTVPRVYSVLAYGYLMMGQHVDPANFATYVQTALAHGTNCLDLDDNDVHVHCILSHVYQFLGRMEDADAKAAHAIELAPSHATALGAYGCALLWAQDYEQAIAYLDRAIQAGKRELFFCWFLLWKSVAQYCSQDFDGCLKTSRDCALRFPGFHGGYRYMGLSLAQMDRVEEAREALESAVAISPTGTPGTPRPPFMCKEIWDLCMDGFAKAGYAAED